MRGEERNDRDQYVKKANVIHQVGRVDDIKGERGVIVSMGRSLEGDEIGLPWTHGDSRGR